jgi:hypothetical protein
VFVLVMHVHNCSSASQASGRVRSAVQVARTAVRHTCYALAALLLWRASSDAWVHWQCVPLWLINSQPHADTWQIIPDGLPGVHSKLLGSASSCTCAVWVCNVYWGAAECVLSFTVVCSAKDWNLGPMRAHCRAANA